MTLFLVTLVLLVGWVALAWWESAPERRQLRDFRGRMGDGSTGAAPLRFPIVFPSEQAAQAAAPAVRALGFEYAVERHPSPLVQRWAHARARLPLSLRAIRRARRRLQRAVGRHGGRAFGPLDAARSDSPDHAA